MITLALLVKYPDHKHNTNEYNSRKKLAYLYIIAKTKFTDEKKNPEHCVSVVEKRNIRDWRFL